jgi:ketosteroid isomerase-like protein
MSTDAAYRELIARYFRLIGQGDIEGVVACFAEDGTFWPPVAPEPLRGHVAIRAFFEGLIDAFDARHEVTTRVVVDGDRALSELVFDAELPDGRPVHFENCNTYTFRDGRFGDVRVFADAAGMRRQMAVD